MSEQEKRIFAQLQIDGINDESFSVPPTVNQSTPIPVQPTTSNVRSCISITRIQTPTITENVQSQLFESTIEQATEQIVEQTTEQIVEQLRDQLTELTVDKPENQNKNVPFKPDAGAGTSRSFRKRALSNTSITTLRNGKPKRLSKSSIKDVDANTKFDPKKHIMLLDYTNIRDKYPNIKEDIYLPFKVKQPDAETLAIENEKYFEQKHLEHPTPPTDEDKERAKRHGYVLGDDWKTQFTIKAFHGTRRIGSVIHQIAVEFSSGPIQWENVTKLKKNARLSLTQYLKKLNLN